MNTTTAAPAPRFNLHDADRVGVAASVLCAIHCGLAPILLLAMPAFGKIWAHPASHALVAILIVPLAVFSIRKGYRMHRRRWVAVVATTGILCVLVGAVLPAFGKEVPVTTAATPAAPPEGAATSTCADGECADGECANAECSDGECADEACASEECAETCASAEENGDDEAGVTTVGCVDNCCPSAQISETGEISLHIPPAAIVTTLGGLFLITAHVGNLMGCRRCCGSKPALA